MVCLVDVLVYPRVVLQPVNPVNAEVGKAQKQRRTRHQVWPPVIIHSIVHFRMPSDLSNEPRQHQEVDPWRRNHARFDLQPNLILDISGMMFESTIKEEVVGEGTDYEVDDEGADERHRP